MAQANQQKQDDQDKNRQQDISKQGNKNPDQQRQEMAKNKQDDQR